MPEQENTLDVKKAFEVIARIIGAREGVNITVKSVKEVQNNKTV